MRFLRPEGAECGVAIGSPHVGKIFPGQGVKIPRAGSENSQSRKENDL